MLYQAAGNQVKDLAYIHGYCKLNQYQTGFSINFDSLYVTVRDSSSRMINKKMIYWEDGDLSLIMLDPFLDFNTTTHNYMRVGNYTITRKVWWSGCDSGEVIKFISLPLSNYQIDNSRNFLPFYSNPTKDFITIKVLKKNS